MSSRAAVRTAGPVTIYVANEAGNTVTPIRAAGNRAGRPITVGPGPELIAISPDGQTAYVVGVGSLLPEEAAAPVTLTAIRTATNRPGRVITVCASGNLGGVIAPYAIAITSDSRTVYVSCAGSVVPVRAGAENASEPIRVSSPISSTGPRIPIWPLPGRPSTKTASPVPDLLAKVSAASTINSRAPIRHPDDVLGPSRWRAP